MATRVRLSLLALLTAGATALVSLLPVPPPAVGAVTDAYWAGTWLSRHRGTKGMTLRLRQRENDADVWGTYMHPKDHGGDRGTIQATAQGDFGKTLVGTYTSSNGGGEGHFKLHLKDDLNSFGGKFWPCEYVCRSILWSGNQPGFGD